MKETTVLHNIGLELYIAKSTLPVTTRLLDLIFYALSLICLSLSIFCYSSLDISTRSISTLLRTSLEACDDEFHEV